MVAGDGLRPPEPHPASAANPNFNAYYVGAPVTLEIGFENYLPTEVVGYLRGLERYDSHPTHPPRSANPFVCNNVDSPETAKLAKTTVRSVASCHGARKFASR